MSKRLQVLLDEREFRAIARAAQSENATISDWVRQVLRSMLAARPHPDSRKKLDAIRAAVSYDFPAPDIEQMNAEIVRGYGAGWPK